MLESGRWKGADLAVRFGCFVDMDGDGDRSL